MNALLGIFQEFILIGQVWHVGYIPQPC